MKLGIWTLIVALVLWTSSADICVEDALAAGVSVGDVNIGSTSTKTDANKFTSTMPTPPAPTVTQLQHQNDANKLNQQGDNSSTSLGLAAIAAGMAMMAAGAAMMASPPTVAPGMALMAAGIALMMAGMAALAAASNMRKNGQQAGGYANNLGPTAESVKSIGPGNLSNESNGSSIKIDPALARNGGKIGEILNDFENKTGLSRDDLINGLNAGKSPAEILAGSSKIGKSESELQKMIDSTMANTNPLTGEEVMDRLGLNAQDLAGEGAYSASGGDRKINSAAPATDFDSLFGKPGAGDTGGGVALGGGTKDGSISPEVQAALDRNGISSRSIFEMVRAQYHKKTPLMFGVKREQVDAPRPIFDLKGTAALEL